MQQPEQGGVYTAASQALGYTACNAAVQEQSALVQQGAATAPKNIPWTYDENEILLVRVRDCTDSRGRPKWAQVAKGLPGRTPQEARCRYRRISDAKTRLKQGEKFRNKCHTCGQPRRGHICPGATAAVVASRCAANTAATAAAAYYKLAALREPQPEQPKQRGAPLPQQRDGTGQGSTGTHPGAGGGGQEDMPPRGMAPRSSFGAGGPVPELVRRMLAEKQADKRGGGAQGKPAMEAAALALAAAALTAPPPPPPPQPPPPSRARPFPPGEPARAPKAPRSRPAFGEEGEEDKEGEEGEEGFHALLALFKVGRHGEPASPHPMPTTSTATAAALATATIATAATVATAAAAAATAAAAAAEQLPPPPRAASLHPMPTSTAAAAALGSAEASAEANRSVDLRHLRHPGGSRRGGDVNRDDRWSAAAKKMRSQSSAEEGRGVFQFTCKHPGCGKAYSTTDGARKHCRTLHRDWLSSLSGYGPDTYCSWEECP